MSIREARRTTCGAINLTATGAVITVPAGYRALVTSYSLSSSATLTAKWTSGSTDLTGARTLVAGGQAAATGSRSDPVLRTVADGDDLGLTLVGAGTVAGHISYILIPTSEA